MSKEAMKRAKEVMANARDWFGNDPEHRWDEDEVYHELVDSVVDLCKAIAEAEKQEQGEPVCDKDPQGCYSVRCQLGNKCKNTPQQRTWVELTKGEIESWELPVAPTIAEFAWFVEEKVKEKNL